MVSLNVLDGIRKRLLVVPEAMLVS